MLGPSRSLHGACNYLLAIGGLCDSMHQMSHFIFLYIIATGTNFISYPLCTKLQVVPLAGLNYGLLMTLFIGLDRLVGVLFPMMHRSVNKACYVGCFLFFGAAYNTFWFYHIFSFAATHSELKVGCVIPDTMPAYVGSMWFTGCVTINALTVVCYASVWIAILKMGQIDDRRQRVFKSLSVIMAIVVGGWTVSAIDRIVLLNSKIDPFSFYFIANYFGIPINVACASHFFVLYTFR
ncbi:Protein SRSX-34 c [Aphelenchoides avenae]|nr:Protein SRSX-34 c [Aphelenchus avenae]